MPFRSKAQMRFMYARHPEIAKRWSSTYGTPHNLPEHVPSKRKKHAVKKPPLGSGERFRQLAAHLRQSGAHDPNAVAAAIGRKKYGKSRFQKLAAHGRRRHR